MNGRPVSTLAAALAIGMGLLVLLGWWLEIATLKSVLPGLAEMKANTALCVVLAGGSLWLDVAASRDATAGRGARVASRVAAAAVLLIGGLTLSEYVLGWNAGIDELLFGDEPGAPPTSYPGRMAPNTALGFLLLSGALLLSERELRPGIRPAEWLALAAGAVGLAGLVGYAYSAAMMYRLTPFTGMAVHTALALVTLSVGALASRPDSPLARILRSPGPGGRLVRRLLPAVVLVPLVIGWLRLQAVRTGLIGSESGTAAVVTALIVALTLVVYLAGAEADRLEVQRSRAQDLLRTAVDASPSGMLMVDPAGRIVLANPQAEAIFGYSAGELTGLLVERLLPEELREAHRDLRRDFLADPQARQMGAGRDLRARRKDGGEIPVEIGLSPVSRDRDTFVLASIIDITERKRIEEELLRSNEELERFAYVASHDLQEPLRMVGSYVQLIARRYSGKLDDDADEFIGFAVEGAGRAQELIEGLLAISRVGTHGEEQVPTDANVVLGRVLKSLDLAIDEANASVTADDLPIVAADPAQLERVFLNLISNALKFRGADPPRVHVTATRRGAEWLFNVRDNGIGIDQQHFDRIFVIFQRLHGRSYYPGTGLGLALTKKIVERHGGRIWVESAPGEGSTFYFTLPGVREDRL